MRISRRSALSGAAALAVPYILPRAALGAQVPRYNPADFGTIGAGDDTAAWQAAIDAAQARNGGRGGIVEPDSLPYAISSLNCTNKVGLVIDAPPGCVLYGCNQTTAAPILDFTSSNYCIISGVWLAGAMPLTQTPPPVIPKAGILLAMSQGGDSNKIVLRDVQSSNYFSSGAVCIVGTTDCQFDNCALQQMSSSAPCLMISTSPDWGISSLFKPLIANSGNVGEHTFKACELHGGHANGTDYWTTYMRNADNVRFIGGLSDCSGRAHMLFQQNCRKVTSVGQHFYSENGHAPDYLFHAYYAADGCSDLCVVNPNEANSAYSIGRTLGPGTFPNFRVL